ncbi:hypothetical protein ONA00_05485 [Mycoplasmopsis cynos]|nr:hypothetical protein [Mycoplasmopsis cynos]WAM11516.1 hypothetical protein ONA00_05485 [Mycoplasmopsis cynos]
MEFTKWFIDNVAWGPDLVTLESFRIVPGVEQNGNAITLGSHSTVHKESSEIKFFPDAFFGPLPIYSSPSWSWKCNRFINIFIIWKTNFKSKCWWFSC